MTINECRQYCKEVANEFINKDAKKFLSEYGFEIDLRWNKSMNSHYLGLFIGTEQTDVAIFPIALNPRAIYNYLDDSLGYVSYDDVEYIIKSTLWHEVGHGICAYIDLESYDEEEVCEEFSKNMMENTHSGKLISELNKYFKDLNESIDDNTSDRIDEFLQSIKNKLTNPTHLIEYLGITMRTTFDVESPMFILPSGGIISVGDVLDSNEEFLPFDMENIHSGLIKCYVIKSAMEYGMSWEDMEVLGDYRCLDFCEDIIHDYLYKHNWIKINCGESWEEPRFYTVLPNKVTSQQYKVLEDWLELGVDLNKESVLIFATDSQDFHLYPLDSDLFPEDIIKRIKRRYSSGMFHEKHSLNSNLTEAYEKRDGIVYDHYSTGVVGEQVNFVVVATKDDVLIGYIQYGYYKGTVNIQMIKVSDAYRRQGIATKMMQYLQKQYPDTEINPGMTTPDGTEFFKNIFVEVPSADKQKLFNRKTRWEKSYYKMAEELKGVEKELDDFYNTPDEDISDEYREHIQAVADRWQELYDKMRDIDHKLWDFYSEYGKMTSPKKNIVKGEF